RRRPPCSPLFPYTTLFRSRHPGAGAAANHLAEQRVQLHRVAVGEVVVQRRVSTGFELVGEGEVLLRQVGRQVDALCTGDLTGLRSEEHTSELQSRENLVCR